MTEKERNELIEDIVEKLKAAQTKKALTNFEILVKEDAKKEDVKKEEQKEKKENYERLLIAINILHSNYSRYITKELFELMRDQDITIGLNKITLAILTLLEMVKNRKYHTLELVDKFNRITFFTKGFFTKGETPASIDYLYKVKEDDINIKWLWSKNRIEKLNKIKEEVRELSWIGKPEIFEIIYGPKRSVGVEKTLHQYIKSSFLVNEKLFV